MILLIKDGEFVKVSFTGSVKLTGEVFDTTEEDVAKKEGIYDEKKKYGPVLVIVGKGMVIPGVERKIKEMDVGEEKEFDVPVEEAFGKRDPKKIKIVSYSRFKKDKVEPFPGLYVSIDGKEAKIQSVAGGRVRVDFNHPLAGKKLHYKLKILEKIIDAEKKCEEIVKKYGMNVIIKGISLNKEKGKLRVTIEKDIPTSVKDVIEKQIKKYVDEIKSVEFELKPLPSKDDIKGKSKSDTKETTNK